MAKSATADKKTAPKATRKKRTVPPGKGVISKTEEIDKPRQLRRPHYKPFRLQPRIKHPSPKLPDAFRLFGSAVAVLWRHWAVFGGIVLVYGLLVFVFVSGLSAGTDITSVKGVLNATAHSIGGELRNGTALFAYMLSTSSTTSGYQIVFLLATTLALIWALRQAYTDGKLGVRDSFYRGMYPVVPFLLVLCTVALQLVPLIFGAVLYNAAVSSGTVAVFPAEKFAWASVSFLLALLSLYMICSSVFALYIVTLPDMTPMRALRSARNLVLYRRWSVIRKILFLPLALLVIGMVIMVPIILFVTSAATWVFFLLGLLLLPVINSYLYALYRALL